MNLIASARQQISHLTAAAYQKAVVTGALPADIAVNYTIEVAKPGNGDFASSFALSASKAMKQNPRTVAQAIADNLDLSGSFFDAVEIAGPGFMNFTYGAAWYGKVLEAVETEGTAYGTIDEGKGKKIMVEFVSANPTGTMTIGNARGGVLGDAMASVLERAGYDVWREFYVNNAGNQIEKFGKSLEVRYLQALQGEDSITFPEDGYHGVDIKELAAEIIEKFGDKFLTMPSAARQLEMREYGIGRNIEKMKRDLERYNIHYNEFFLETALHESGYVKETIDILEQSGHTYEKDGALWINLVDLGYEKDEVLRRTNGGYTYFAVDIAYHRNKFEVRGFDKVIDVLGADHHGHALRFKAAIGTIGIDPERLDFLIMQFVHLVRNGESVKVSKRSGKVITLSDLLDEISVDAARFFFNAKPSNHLEFDLDLAVRQDGENPVYYVQYAHARIGSIIRNLAEDGIAVQPFAAVDTALLTHESERALIKRMASLPEEISVSAKNYDPSQINRYLMNLAADFHKFYNDCSIKNADSPALRLARLKLAACAKSVLAICLGIIGVTAPEQM